MPDTVNQDPRLQRLDMPSQSGGGYDQNYADRLKNTNFSPVAPGKTWGGYFQDLGGDIDYNDLKRYTDSWGADPSFPWHLMMQDYLNWGAGGKRVANIGEGGRIEFDGDVLDQDILGEASPTSMAEFGWDDNQINEYSQGVKDARKNLYDKYQTENILPLYDLPAQMLQNTQRAGIGKAPGVERPPVGFGGSLLESDSSGLVPFGGSGGEQEIPLSIAQQLIGGV